MSREWYAGHGNLLGIPLIAKNAMSGEPGLIAAQPDSFRL